MDQLLVLFPFVGILVGLGLADLVFSVHRTIRAKKQWDVLPAVWVAFTFVVVLAYWWVFSEVGRDAALASFPGFAFHVVSPLLLILVCAAALPDAGDDRDLRTYYAETHRYYFGLFALYFLHAALDYGFNYGTWQRAIPWTILAFSTATALLAATPNRRVHLAVTGLLVSLLVGSVLTFAPSL